MTEPGMLPDGFTVDAVDWLPSGARSGLVRVRGHRPPAVAGPLPELILEAGGDAKRYVSLPDPRADRDPTAWRGAYVLEAKPAAEADNLWLEWPGARRIALPPLSVPEHQVTRSAEAERSEPSPGGEVIDRAVLAERRARRAESSEQAQARIAREAMRAVEVLELRANEFEQRALEAEAERDLLRERGGSSGIAAAPGPVEPDVRLEVLSAEVRELRSTLAQREAELDRKVDAPAPAPVAEPMRIAPGDAERRAERLRSALTATVATVAELRMRLHELQLARRTRDVSAAADAVRLTVLDRERATLAAEHEAAKVELQAAVEARDAAEAARAEATAALDEARDESSELREARDRIAVLEAEVEALTARVERASGSETDLRALRERLAAAEAGVAAAETARELAEATALAAATRRHAEDVARAANPAPAPPTASWSPERRHIDLSATSVDPVPVPEPEPVPTPAPRVPESLIAAAAEAERAAAERQPTEESARIAADIDAAAAALRSADAEPAAAVERTPARITSPATDPPADLARGRSVRDYPPLRGALVKLAHDDPAAAGRILAGLLKAQHAVLDEAPDYDITIAEVGTFAVSAAGQTTLVSALEAPRGRGQAAFHLQTDALTFAEAVAGVQSRPRRRRGPLRATGKVRAARKLTEGLRADASLAEIVAAGADLDPGLVLRGLAYAVRPAWTQGQQWVVELHVDDRPVTVAARHSGGLSVTDGPHDSEPDARLRLSAQAFRDLVAGVGATPRGEGDERVLVRLLTLAERARTGAE